tara:strand:- start:419 stop:745 length:327 start_codon:yes stop_codon:yes gene_type:complete
MSDTEQAGLELEGAGAKLKMRNINPRLLVDSLAVATLAFIGVMSMDHRAELQSMRKSDIAGRAEMIVAIHDLAASQRFLGCILAAEAKSIRDKVECSNQLRSPSDGRR